MIGLLRSCVAITAGRASTLDDGRRIIAGLNLDKACQILDHVMFFERLLLKLLLHVEADSRGKERAESEQLRVSGHGVGECGAVIRFDAFVVLARAESLEVKDNDVHVTLFHEDRAAKHPDTTCAFLRRPLRSPASGCDLLRDLEAFAFIVLPDQVKDTVEHVRFSDALGATDGENANLRIDFLQLLKCLLICPEHIFALFVLNDDERDRVLELDLLEVVVRKRVPLVNLIRNILALVADGLSLLFLLLIVDQTDIFEVTDTVIFVPTIVGNVWVVGGDHLRARPGLTLLPRFVRSVRIMRL